LEYRNFYFFNYIGHDGNLKEITKYSIKTGLRLKCYILLNLQAKFYVYKIALPILSPVYEDHKIRTHWGSADF